MAIRKIDDIPAAELVGKFVCPNQGYHDQFHGYPFIVEKATTARLTGRRLARGDYDSVEKEWTVLPVPAPNSQSEAEDDIGPAESSETFARSKVRFVCDTAEEAISLFYESRKARKAIERFRKTTMANLDATALAGELPQPPAIMAAPADAPVDEQVSPRDLERAAGKVRWALHVLDLIANQGHVKFTFEWRSFTNARKLLRESAALLEPRATTAATTVDEAVGYIFTPSFEQRGAVMWAVAMMLRKWSALSNSEAGRDEFTTAMRKTLDEFEKYAKPTLGESAATSQGLSDDDVYAVAIQGWQSHSKQSYSPDGLHFAALGVRDAVLRAVSALPAFPPEVPGTYMTADQGRDWAWNTVKEDVGTEGWTAADSGNFNAFFLWGWNYRGQYEQQRAAAASPLRAALA